MAERQSKNDFNKLQYSSLGKSVVKESIKQRVTRECTLRRHYGIVLDCDFTNSKLIFVPH